MRNHERLFCLRLAAGKPIAEIAVKQGVDEWWKNNAILPVLLIARFATNLVWYLLLNALNRSLGDYTNHHSRLANNYGWAMLAGVSWYFQFFLWNGVV